MAVRRERIDDARPGEDEAVRAPERRHENRRRHPRAAAGQQGRGRGRADAVLWCVGDARKAQRVEVSHVREHVEARDERAAEEERAREGAAGLPDLGAGERHVRPGRLRERGPDEREGEGQDEGAREGRIYGGGGVVRAAEEDSRRRQGDERGDLEGGQDVLQARSRLEPERVRGA